MSAPKHWATSDVLMMICHLDRAHLAFLKDHPDITFDSLMIALDQRRDLAHEVLRLRTEVDMLRSDLEAALAKMEESK